MVKLSYWLILLLLYCGSDPVQAAGDEDRYGEEDELLTEDDFLEDMPLVLTVTRLTQTAYNAPATISILDRDTIQASGINNIPDLLRLVPGFLVGWSSGNRTSVTYRGLSDGFSRRMQLLIDGRSIYEPLIGSIPWPALALSIEDIERIEVIRGPNTPAYGANAFLGIINIITRHPGQDPGLRFKVFSDRDDNSEIYLRQGFSTDNFDMRVSASFNQDDGFDNVADSRRDAFITFRGDYLGSNNQSWSFQGGWNRGDRGTDIVPPERDTAVLTYGYTMTRWQWNHSAEKSTSVRFYHNRFKYVDEVVTDETLEFGGAIIPIKVPVNFNWIVDRFNLEFQQIAGFGARARLVWGAEAREDRARSRTYLDTEETRTNQLYRLFGNLEWRFSPELTGNLGLMAENNDVTGGDTSPRLALNYHFAPNRGVRLSYTEALRTPTLIEAYGDNNYRFTIPIGGGIPAQVHRFEVIDDVDSESIRSYEIGYIHELFQRRLQLDVKIYQDDLSDFISTYGYEVPLFEDGVLNLDTEVISFHNLYNIRTRGLEVQADFRPIRKTHLRLSFSAARPRILNPDADAIKEERSIPELLGALFLNHQFRRNIHVSATWLHMGATEFLEEGEYLEAWNQFDARVGYQFKIRQRAAQAAIVVQNIGDERFEFRDENVREANQVFLHFGITVD